MRSRPGARAAAAVRGAGWTVEAGVEDEAGDGDLGHAGKDGTRAAAIPATLEGVRIDHAIWATQDRDAAASHTHNRIVPLGGGYLELLAVADADEAAGSPDPGEGGDAGGLSWVEVAGDAGRVREWLGGVGLPVRVQQGEPALLAVDVGERELR